MKKTKLIVLPYSKTNLRGGGGENLFDFMI